MNRQRPDGPCPRTQSVPSKSWWGLLGTVATAFTVGCQGSSSSDDGSGGSAQSSGAAHSGGVAQSSGGAQSGGGNDSIEGGASSGGLDSGPGGGMGSAGAPALPGCGCSDASSITVEFAESTVVYDRTAESGDSCNPLACEPEAPYAVWRGAPPSRYGVRACNADDECVSIETGALGNEMTQGRITIQVDDELRLREPALVEATQVLDVQEPTVEFTFEAVSPEVSIRGSAIVCAADSNYICAR